MKIWLLTDDRRGNVNQLLGVAEALNEPFECKEIRYTKWVKIPNGLRGSSLLGLDRASRERIKPPFPDVVISAGRRSYPVALYIQRVSGKKTKVVQLMNPGAYAFRRADLIVLPSHDKKTIYTKNVLRVLGAPHRTTADRLAAEKEIWEPKFKKYPAPRLSVIVGGATKDKPFTLEMGKTLVQEIKKMKPKSILLTTSRRTPNNVIALLQKELSFCPTFFYRFGDKGENPYFGLLACADKIVVTGDSISMCTECCATNVPVFIFAPDDMIGDKHKRFLTALFKAGYATPLGEKQTHQSNRPLNPADDIARAIKKLK